MKKFISILTIISFFISCNSDNKKSAEKGVINKTGVIKNTDYELIKPSQKSKAVLILFGGYPENAEDIKREFNIIEVAKENNIAIIFMNFNQKLWLEENEKKQLALLLQKTITENGLPTDNIFIGGFSSGGTVSLLISDYIIGMKQFYIDPKGVFIIDSPIDLLGLYYTSKKNVKQNFSDISVKESTWIIETLEKQFGNPEKGISEFEKYSVYTLKTETIKNLRNLKNIEIRLYTEPDTIWWKKNRMADYENMNAYYIKRLSEKLKEGFGNTKVEYMPTENRGYRANGERHPHSWAIVDEKELIDWILKEK